jgi:NAD(P)-dependent dehydrogenase (short-subunit alcohol dehydrogenase family)
MSVPGPRTKSSRRLSDQVVVVTGASSGIGRETSQQLARHGARVVLAARRSEALEAAAAEVRALGGTALAVRRTSPSGTRCRRWSTKRGAGSAGSTRGSTGPRCRATASSRPRRSRRSSGCCRSTCSGRSTASKSSCGSCGPRGRARSSPISSGLGVRSVPLQVPYRVAKHGVVALYEGLRLEEEHARSGVAVTTVLPASVNTPLFDVAASWMGVRPTPIPPVYEPSVVAAAVLAAAERPQRHVFVGGAAAQMAALQRLSPALTDQVLTVRDHVFVRQQRTDALPRPSAPRVAACAATADGAVAGRDARPACARRAPRAVARRRPPRAVTP